MNKIIIGNDGIEEQTLDNSVSVNYNKNQDFLSVNSLEINFLDNSEIEIYYKIKGDFKLSVIFNFTSDISVNLFEKYSDGSLKINNIYNLETNSNVNVRKFYDVDLINQYDSINLNGEKSCVNYILKTIGTNLQKYNLVVNHNASYTESSIINNAVNLLDGEVVFNVDGVIPKGNIGCYLNQNNRIVTFNEKKCQINPNLYIDENDIIANHSAYVGKFSDDELFYLQSRGIKYADAIKLLIIGFLVGNMELSDAQKQDFIKIIDKYWR